MVEIIVSVILAILLVWMYVLMRSVVKYCKCIDELIDKLHRVNADMDVIYARLAMTGEQVHTLSEIVKSMKTDDQN